MIELLGVIYDVAKGVKDYLTWNEEEKLVDINWPTKSGLKARAEADGWQIQWCRPDRVASLELDGYEILYEMDKLKRIRRKLVLYDGSVLVRKRQAA
ncbi:MAG TPA: hypothetical protein VLL05_17830 [Terriglobales bacterium]|nr:hypothetical protein [Terriglobales bacterium]